MDQDTEQLRRQRTDEGESCCTVSVADQRPEVVQRDLAVLKTLGDETRYTLVRTLVDAGEELCVCELAPLVDVSDSAVSHALSDLVDAGLLARRKEGTWRHYRPTERAEELLGALEATREVSADV